MDCIELIVALMTAGMSVNHIKNVLEQKSLTFYHTQRMKFKSINSSTDDAVQFTTVSSWKKCFSSILPSNHSISSCFLADFWSKESVYVRCMQDTTVDDINLWLSLDHTFSSASELAIHIILSKVQCSVQNCQ